MNNFQYIIEISLLNLEELATLLAVEWAPVLADAVDLQAPESNEAG